MDYIRFKGFIRLDLMDYIRFIGFKGFYIGLY